MIICAVPGGTSGHLIGCTLAGEVLVPWGGALVMIVVVILQMVVFPGGGLTVLGSKICNTGLIGTFAGYYLYKAIRFAIGRNKLSGMAVGAAIAAWASVMIAAIICAIQLAISGTVPLAVAIGAMATWHVLIGIGEAAITVVALVFIWRTRPDMFYDPPRRAVSPRNRIGVGS